MIPRIETASGVTVFIDGRAHTVYKTSDKYAKVLAAIEAENLNEIRANLGLASSLESYTKGHVTVADGVVLMEGKQLHNAITQKILALFRAGKKYDYILNFFKRIQANSSPKAVDELYLFLEKAQIPITPEGHFLAYRKVDNEYMSYHANPDGTKNRNQIGDVVTMDRKTVNENRHNTCAQGLHFCSFSYLSSYYGGQGRVMIVSIDPADVVSIPSDYSNAKGRCCKYTVIAEHGEREKQEAYKDVVLANPDGTIHEAKDIDVQQNLTSVAENGAKSKTEKRIIGYIRAKLDSNVKPTLRQIQSVLSPQTPTILSLSKRVVKLGFELQTNKVLSKSTVDFSS